MNGPETVPGAVVALVEWVRSLPYGRPIERTSSGMLAERKGTCSTKHAFLYEVLIERYPELGTEVVHRVYRLDRERATAAYGARVASAVPAEGVTDVHRYLTVVLGPRRVVIDATFPGAPWDGATSMPLSCGAGTDHVAIGDPDAAKRDLEARHCDPAVREPFIAALSRASGPRPALS